jgi:hypothetical protein
MKSRKRAARGALMGAAMGLLLASTGVRPWPQDAAQEQPPPQDVRKPGYDYMSTFLSRNTKPMSLKEDPAVRRMLGQGPVSWAIRAGSRHVLD